jgi:hypothetical protein
MKGKIHNPDRLVLAPFWQMNATEVAALQMSVQEYAFLLEWTSYGPDGDEGPIKRTLGELDTDHLEAILITQCGLSPEYRAAILYILKDRYLFQL